MVAGTPVLLREVPSGWAEQTTTKTRFGNRPSWRRLLLNPQLTTKGHQRRRLGQFLSGFAEDALVVDIGSSFRRLGERVVCLDLVPTPGIDVVGNLHRIPLKDDSVEGIVCTGVLEHVEEPERVVAEIRRVLGPGGRLYLSVPFLQGYHPSPNDFRRFTKEGIERLVRDFEVEAIVTTRGSASTVTWVLSSFLATLVAGRSFKAYALARAVFGWILLPLKYLDYLVARSPFDEYVTSGFTAIAVKPRASSR